MQNLVYQTCLFFFFLTLFKMKKIHIQLQVEEVSVDKIMRQVSRFVRCTRYFMFILGTYFLYQVMRLWEKENLVQKYEAVKDVAIFLNFLWFFFYLGLTCYFMYLSEQYYVILAYSKRTILI